MRNKDYKMVVELNTTGVGAVVKRRRFLIGVHSLAKYVSQRRANFIYKKMPVFGEDKLRVKIKGKGLVDVYLI